MNQIPVREIKTYQTEDERKIEEHSFSFYLGSKEKNEETQKVIYVGVLALPTSTGIAEIKFEIEANSLKEAFDKYEEETQKILKEIQGDTAIVTASESELEMLEKLKGNESSIIIN